MEKKTLPEIAKEVAKLLGFPNWKEFTGHTLRRSSTTSAANSGAGPFELTKHCRWASPKMAMEYIGASDKQTKKIGRLIAGENHSTANSSEAIQPFSSSQVSRTLEVTSTVTSQVINKNSNEAIVSNQVQDPKRNMVFHITGGSHTFNF